jgi:hypothetical protein
MTRDDFMENTLDLWEIPAESATRVGHPAPFPVELPERLIELYTYRADLVLDPFAGSGTTAVAALRTGRHYVGYDLDEAYIRLAETRVEEERQRLAQVSSMALPPVRLRPIPEPAGAGKDVHSRALREGLAANEIARIVVEAAGFSEVRQNQRHTGGIEVALTARDSRGELWLFDIAGTFTNHRPGLKRADTLWRTLGRAAVLRQVSDTPLVVLTTGVPGRGPGAEALRQVVGPGKPIHCLVEMVKPEAIAQLGALCHGAG